MTIDRLRVVAAALCVAAWPASGLAASADGAAERNWFDDPFFQVSAADPACPLPAGPFVDERGKREQAHRRAEKGTTCWLAGRCERPKAYLYDADIAAAVTQAFAAATARFAGSTLWVTVQGRVVYVEGCVRDAAQAADAEALVRALPDVEQAVAIVRVPPARTPPYRVRGPRQRVRRPRQRPRRRARMARLPHACPPS